MTPSPSFADALGPAPRLDQPSATHTRCKSDVRGARTLPVTFLIEPGQTPEWSDPPRRVEMLERMEHPDPPVVEAFQLAANRWFCATGEASRLQVDEYVFRFATIGEILFWAVALDDTIQHPDGRDDLRLGLRFARNRATHDLVRTVDDKPGAKFPLRFPARFVHFVWRDADALPIPASGLGSGPGGRGQQRSYEQAWEGQHVDQTVRELGRHFGLDLIG